MTAGSPILTFYRGGCDDRGRRLAEILAWSDARLEAVHDYIQWVFPLPEASGANPSAPVLSQADIAAFGADPGLRQRLAAALERMQAFYGLRPPGPMPWLTPGNHNYLRLTRMLRCLRTLGLEAEARELFAQLEAVYRDHAAVIGAVTFGFWRRAMAAALS
ncbi:MAG TPA: opioid growth factor receptor-related protein [Terriglobales bacterium]